MARHIQRVLMRPNRLSRPRRIAVTTVTALSLLASGAVAYWSTPGEANASANLATLPSPTISTATPGAGTVELTWSAVTPPGGGTVEYFVTRDGGSPGGGCPKLRLSLDRDELHRHGRPDRHARVHGHGRVAHLDGDEHGQIGDRRVRSDHPSRARSRERHAHRRRGRQPDDHRQGREQQHGPHLHRRSQPHLRRRRRIAQCHQAGRDRPLGHGQKLRRSHRNHVHRRQGHGG